MFVYIHPRAPSSPLERIMKHIYYTTFWINVASFIISLVQFLDVMEKTYNDFTADPLEFTPQLTFLFDTCSAIEGKLIDGQTAPEEIGTTSLTYLFVVSALIGVISFTCHAFSLLVDLLTKALYGFNTRCFRYRGLIFRWNWVQPFWIFFWVFFEFLLVGASSAGRTRLSDYTYMCASRVAAVSREQYEEIGATPAVLNSFSFTFMIGAQICNLIPYGIAIILVVVDGLRRQNAAIAKYDQPWERGFFGVPNKDTLSRWTIARSCLARALLTQAKYDSHRRLQ